MKDGIKREILHIISAHLMRVKTLSQSFNKTAVHMAMDMVVNDYLEHVDRDAVTVANVNERFGLMLKRFRTIEYYAKAIDKAMKEKPELFVPVDNSDTAVAMEFDLKLAMIFGMNLIPLIRIRWTKLRSAISTKPQRVIWKGM